MVVQVLDAEWVNKGKQNAKRKGVVTSKSSTEFHETSSDWYIFLIFSI